MNKLKNTDPIIVIIATSFARTNLLLERSLKSVYRQININPHQIYIVDDNPVEEGNHYSDEHKKIQQVIKKLRNDILKPKFIEFKNQRKDTHNIKFENFFHTNLIQNTRTRGFSGTGAWNSGAFKSLRYSNRNYFLAFLDDDDEWDRKYLETLFNSVIEPKKNKRKSKTAKTIASITGFLRIEREDESKIQVTKERFNKNVFFIENPGLQGSNLFIELKTFWTIGGFDESLKSATDRDLGIRLAEYVRIRPAKQVAFINDILVKHYATLENRVTTNFNNKKQGLDLFYRKYLHQFPKELQEKSLNRAKKLFNYTISDNPYNTKIETTSNIIKRETIKPFNLIIGTISDNASNLTELFKSFLELHQKDGKHLNDYRFLILENTSNEYEIRPIINYFSSKKKMNIDLIENISKNSSIAKNRTILQTKIYEKGKSIFNEDWVSWVVDDDHLFKFDSKTETVFPNYFRIISEESNNGADAMFGQISDAPPLPFLSTLRTQLIDFYYNLTYFVNCNPNDKFKLNKLQELNIEQKEFYYDLSNNNFQHLEYPYYRNTQEQTNIQAFINFLNETALLSKGVNVFRKLTFDPEKIGSITNSASIYRGGNTIIFNSALLKTPNYTPEEKYNRRSDFNWAIINKYIFNRDLREIVLPLKHDRALQNSSVVTDKKKLQADIKGLIFYRLLENIIEKENWEKKPNNKNELRFYKQIKKHTFTKIKINNYRIQYLIHLILEILKDEKNWWFKKAHCTEINYHICQNIFILDVFRFELGKQKFQILLQELEDEMQVDNEYINKVKEEMKKIKANNNIYS